MAQGGDGGVHAGGKGNIVVLLDTPGWCCISAVSVGC